MKYDLLAVGTDAEFFLRDDKRGINIPVCGLMGGTKQAPKPIPELGEGYCIQEDNVMPEVNIPPCKSAKEFSQSISNILGWLRESAGKMGYSVEVAGSAKFDVKMLAHPQAQTFGCEPDYCVWTREPNEIDRSDPSLKNLRTAAAHIHVGFNVDDAPPDVFKSEPIIKLMDLFVGVPLMLCDNDNLRRKFYGRAGSFRPKPYGIEYRVPSNCWTRSSELVEYTYNQVESLFAVAAPIWEKYRMDKLQPKLTEAINLHDVDIATSIMKDYGIAFPPKHELRRI